MYLIVKKYIYIHIYVFNNKKYIYIYIYIFNNNNNQRK